MDKNKLLYFIKDRGFTVESFCEFVGMSYSSFYGKCKNSKFLLSDIWKITDVLKLSQEDMCSIFFANIVSQKETI